MTLDIFGEEERVESTNYKFWNRERDTSLDLEMVVQKSTNRRSSTGYISL